MLGNIFDYKSDRVITEGSRPHWAQASTITFVTFRTHDSIPRQVIVRWEHEKQEWMRRRGHKADQHWSTTLSQLAPEDQQTFRRHFSRCREDILDNGRGEYLLRRPEIAQIVGESLLYFDGDRYHMGDFVVMPNHVHLLVSFPEPESMRKQFDSWLRYTGTQIHRFTRKRGAFWQQEPFDHLVRSVEQYEYLRSYIANNPRKAGLREGNYLYRRFLDDSSDASPAL